MREIYLRPVDGPRSRRMRLLIPEEDLDRIHELPVGGMRPGHDDPDLLTCGPLSSKYVEIGVGSRLYRVRRGPCGLPSCACAFEYWTNLRRKPLPDPGWSHVDLDDGSCVCGNLARDMRRYGGPA